MTDLLFPFKNIPKYETGKPKVEDIQPSTGTSTLSTMSTTSVVSAPTINNTKHLSTAIAKSGAAFKDKFIDENIKNRDYATAIPDVIETNSYKYDIVDFVDKTSNPIIAHVKPRSMPDQPITTKFVVKIQSRKPINLEQSIYSLEKEFMFLSNLANHLKPDLKNVTRLIDCGFDTDFRYLIIEEYGNDLQTMHQTYKPFGRPLAFLVTYYSFQAIKVIHSLGMLHRDIKPACFGIKKPFSLKIKDFYRTKMKFKNGNQLRSKNLSVDPFSSRRSHKIGELIDEFDDYESWLYTMIHMTCKDQLSWKSNDSLEAKEKFHEDLDSKDYFWFGAADMLCLVPYLLKKHKSVEKFEAEIDELFSMEVKLFDEREQPEWIRSKENMKKSVRAKPSAHMSMLMSVEERSMIITPQKQKTKRNKNKKKLQL